MSAQLLSYTPLLLKAALVTIWLSWLALLIGAVGGTLVALARMSTFLPLRLLALLFTEFFRSIPILIVLFFVFFGVPLIFGLDLSPFAATTIALALHATSTMSEVIRAGLESVGKGQWEAARAAGMTYWQMMRHVIVPQALRVILPPSVGVYIATLKESSLASIIGYVELTKTGLLIRETMGSSFVPLLLLALIYFLINYGISLGGAALERRFHVNTRLMTAGAGQ
ncbi:polar amino acid transport system permease protein [Bosea sp. OK403]|uniref:amino acid ABC transporter permease n=1 Tax=Bosea sp. OK403 TaxID=1855286 RepID=UPI0008E2F042|nr:amino acid ABC transporter permease [Bosea sp. OK403]SFJ56758.1 polar amino acid transport system permease protein [Bosea sp. OK403]